jgi:hypothetical protein
MVKLILDSCEYCYHLLLGRYDFLLTMTLSCRRGRPQYLSKKRYEQYQQLWLTQNIPTYVARTIEPTHHSTDWSRL